jgi:putrescine aminotransferase
VQGAGGVIIPPASYWPEIQRICDQYGILLISDEVICGFGRTGQWFGCEHFGTRPDLMTMAKALSSGYLPIGGVMVGDGRKHVDRQGRELPGFTYSAYGLQRRGAGEPADHPAREPGGACAGPQVPGCSSAGGLAAHPLVGEAGESGCWGAGAGEGAAHLLRAARQGR